MHGSVSFISLAVLASLGAGCTDNTYLIVTVDKRAAVHEASKLKITLSNAGSMRTDDLDLKGHAFPVTFSLTAPGRGGELGISIDALDMNDGLVGRGAGQATLTDMTAQVTLDSADFVVNNEYAGNQFLTNDFEAVGIQISAIAGGNWMPVFRDDCTGTPPACDIYGRRFDNAGLPVQTQLAAGTNQFKISTTLTSPGAIPAVTSSGTTTMAFWDYSDTVGTGQGVACRAINESGAGTPAQLGISTEAADVVTAAPIGNNNYAVTWQTFATNETIHSVIVKGDCTTPMTTPVNISTTANSLGYRRSHVASNGGQLLYVYINDGSVKARPAMFNSTTFVITLGTEVQPVTKTSAMTVDHVRIVPYGTTGYAMGVRWAAVDDMSPGKMEVYKLDANGNVQGTPTLITDTKSGSDFASDKGFSMAARSDGALLVVWHTCPSGPGSCDVYGRILRPSGVPVGEEFMIPTSTGSDQVNPSVVALDAMSFVAAWNDSSQLDPDKSMSAVRARILYPAYDDARSVLGATCGASAPGSPNCATGLACASGSDQTQRCYESCSPPSPCPHGGMCTSVDGVSACTF